MAACSSPGSRPALWLGQGGVEAHRDDPHVGFPSRIVHAVSTRCIWASFGSRARGALAAQFSSCNVGPAHAPKARPNVAHAGELVPEPRVPANAREVRLRELRAAQRARRARRQCARYLAMARAAC
jgi:hypothetical protein